VKWTTEWPTEPGWYWMQDPEVDDTEIVYYDSSRGVVDSSGDRVNPFLEGHAFYGPIKPPAHDQAVACETSKSPQNA
jgi:hypothetical protein